MGVNEEDVKKIRDVVKEMQEVESKDAIVVLYEDYLQNTTEMLAGFLGPIKSSMELPDFVKAVIDTANLNKFIRGLPCERPSLECDLSAQWERFLLVEKLPTSLTGEMIRSKVIEIIAENKGRILAPHLDVYYEEQSLVALVDGWDVVDLVEEEIIEKIEEEEQKEPEEEDNLMIWVCPICTFENMAGNTNCEMCESPPPVGKAVESFEKV